MQTFFNERVNEKNHPWKISYRKKIREIFHSLVDKLIWKKIKLRDLIKRNLVIVFLV